MYNYSPIDYSSLITISIAFNLAFVIKEKFFEELQEKPEKSENKPSNVPDFYSFIKTFITSRLNGISNTFVKRINPISSDPEIYKFEYYVLVKEIEIEPGLYALIEKEHAYSEKINRHISNIQKIYFLPSICLLLGLYGVLVLIAIALLKHFPERCHLFLFHGNVLCIFFLFVCVLWDIVCKEDHWLNRTRDWFNRQDGRCLPRRMNAIWIFFMLVLIGGFYSFAPSKWHFFCFSLPAFWFDGVILGTILVCFGGFIVYFIIIVVKVIWLRYAFQRKYSQLEVELDAVDAIIKSEEYKGWSVPSLPALANKFSRPQNSAFAEQRQAMERQVEQRQKLERQNRRKHSNKYFRKKPNRRK